MSWKSGHSGEIIAEEEDDAFQDDSGSCSSKKSVRFSEVVQKHVFRPTSSILGQTSKNLKKKLQKQRKFERRASEGDVPASSSVENDNRKTSKIDTKPEENNDSGVASSVDEGGDCSSLKSNSSNTAKSKRNRNNKRTNNKSQRKFLSSEAINDLIFDLDDI